MKFVILISNTTALNIAVGKKNLEIVNLLLSQKNIDVNILETKETTIHVLKLNF